MASDAPDDGGGGPGPEERAKAVVRADVEAVNHGDLAALRDLFTDDALIQGVKGFGRFEQVEPIRRQLGLPPEA